MRSHEARSHGVLSSSGCPQIPWSTEVKKVLVASTYLPPTSGGAEHVAWELAKRLARDFEVHIMTTGGGFESPNIYLHYVRHLPLSHMWYSTVAKRKIKTILDEVSPDLVHTHIALPWGYVFRGVRSAKIITCHGSDVFPEKRNPYRFFLMEALTNANVRATPSKWLAKHIEHAYGQTCITIPNGVDTGIFKPLPSVQKSDNVVLFVGRFIALKGISELVEAARALPKYQFWFVGNGGHRRYGASNQPIKIPRLPNVKIVGFIHDERALAIHYNQATICAFPSHRENFPLVGLEAMACGKTLVATRLGFLEYVENGREGLLVEPHDIKGLVESIKYLMENRTEREEFEKNARKKASLYDWEAVAKEYRALYEMVVS